MLDFSTSLGVLGVFLTILFFAVGYRQTIGARKERAKAANRQIVEALFRRLVLDDSFPIDKSGVFKVLLGTALTASVRTDDIHSVFELEAVLCAKAMESDYMDDAKRVEVMERLAKCFADAEDSLPSSVPSRRKGVPPDVWLALGSALTAMVAILASIPLLDSPALNMETIPEPVMGLFVGGLVVLVALTASALTAFTRLRDVTRRTSLANISTTSMALERRFFNAAKNCNRSFRVSTDPRFDYVFDGKSGKSVVEIKFDVNAINASSIKRLVSKLNAIVEGPEFSNGYIVSQISPSVDNQKIQSDSVSIISMAELLRILKESAMESESPAGSLALKVQPDAPHE